MGLRPLPVAIRGNTPTAPRPPSTRPAPILKRPGEYFYQSVQRSIFRSGAISGIGRSKNIAALIVASARPPPRTELLSLKQNLMVAAGLPPSPHLQIGGGVKERGFPPTEKSVKNDRAIFPVFITPTPPSFAIR